LHKNKLSSLPNTFPDLASLTVLDLSYNALTTLPGNIFALPELTTLNLSHNLLISLPFEAPFASASSRTGPNQYTSTSFFTPAVVRATTPLPRLVNLNASHNRIVGSAIDATIPVSLTKIDLSGNPLGPSQRLIQALGALKRLKEAKFEKAEIGDDSFPPGLFSSVPFVDLCLFDLGETQATLEAVQAALRGMKQELNFDFTTDEPPMGVTRVLIGKKIVKESWELELERRAKARVDKVPDWEASNSVTLGSGSKGEIAKEAWEIEAEQGLLTEGAKRRARAAVAATTAKAQATAPSVQAGPSAVVKEAWEIEAEQGLLTEGGKRRARAAAAAAQVQARAELGVGQSPTATPSSTSPQDSVSASLSNPQYYTATTQTLKLPASAAPTKGPGHARAFSLAAPSAAAFSSSVSPSTTDIAVPAPSLPLSVIVVQPFANTLRVLILANRRMDRSFSVPRIPEGPPGFLPKLEELDLEGCNLSDFVSIHATEHTSDAGGETTPPRLSEPIIPTLSKLFPSLQTLNLSYNALTNASLNPEALSTLILTSPHRRGLRHLRLRGNRISDLDGFVTVAEQFKGNREVPGWKMEELDLRDNEIGKLPPELGLLPLDVLLVDGNTWVFSSPFFLFWCVAFGIMILMQFIFRFRVPQRRVWEREGTKGLLSWLRGRIE
jgi:Leucine-rich repeat (LRR) protein